MLRSSAGPPSVTSRAERGHDREPAIRGRRVRPADDADHRRAFGLRRSRCSGSTLRRDPRIGTRVPPTSSSACQRSPERWTSTTSPRTRTSRHSWAALGATRRSSALDRGRRRAAGPASARIRGAPYARPISPLTRTRLPTAGAVAPVGRRTSTPAVRSSIDDPPAGRVEQVRADRHEPLDGHVAGLAAGRRGDRDRRAGRPCRTGRPSCRASASAWRADPVRTTSAASRSQIAVAVGGALAARPLADDPGQAQAIVGRDRGRGDAGPRRRPRSGSVRSASSSVNVMSPLVAFAGFASAVPSTVTRRASIASPTETAVDGDRAGQPSPGRRPAARRRGRAPPAGRTGRRGCRSPRRACRAPAAGPCRRSGRRSPAVESWIASSGGVPSRPASAVTTPLTVTRRPIGEGPRLGDRDRGRGGAGLGLGLGLGAVDGVGVGVGAGVGLGDGGGTGARGAATGSGVARRSASATASASGVGDGAARRRRARRPAWRGGDSRQAPVPLLSRWPSGPTAMTTSPVCDRRAGQRGRRRHDPERPAPVVDRDAEPVAQRRRRLRDDPVTASRMPSRVSSAPPVVAPSGSGSGPGSSTSGRRRSALRTRRLK